MALFTYEATLLPDCPWARVPANARTRLIWTLWALTLVGLIAGYFDRRFWNWVVGFSVAHALLALSLVKWRPLVFPAQLRVAYAAWVATGTYCPHMNWMLYLATAGVTANLLSGWCPMARTLYLLPWNRQEPFDAGLPWRTFFAGPTPGRFKARPKR